MTYAYKFGAACLDLARELTDVMDSAATADGSTTPFITLIDTSMPIPTPADDFYNQGTIFFTSGANIDLMRRVTDFTNSTGTYQFNIPATGITARTAALDTYSVMDRHIPLYVLKQSINKALMQIGDVDKLDVTTVTVADQLSYTLPSGVFHVKRVEVGTSLTTPYDYEEISHWEEVNGVLIFKTGHAPDAAGYLLRITYNAPYTAITADTTAIATNISPEYIKWVAAAAAYRWKLKKIRGDDPYMIQMMNEAIVNAEDRAREHRPKMVLTGKVPQYSPWAVLDNERELG